MIAPSSQTRCSGSTSTLPAAASPLATQQDSDAAQPHDADELRRGATDALHGTELRGERMDEAVQLVAPSMAAPEQ